MVALYNYYWIQILEFRHAKTQSLRGGGTDHERRGLALGGGSTFVLNESMNS